jgi:hypothetical protein
MLIGRASDQKEGGERTWTKRRRRRRRREVVEVLRDIARWQRKGIAQKEVFRNETAEARRRGSMLGVM